MTESVNKNLTITETLFKNGVWTPAVQAVLADYGLNFWPLTAIASLLSDALYGKISIVIDVTAVAFINEAHRKAFNEEELKLQVLAVEYPAESKEFKDELEKSIDSLASFVHMGPT